ncbi:MAG: polysaccharide deacetylase family protein [Archangiaceae bacterium]|nr:polysaccharide deacetylase family protein [Archangiaceae bacterium]
MQRASTHRPLSFDGIVHRTAGHLPRLALRPMLGASLKGLSLALCFHRVGHEPRETDWQPGLTMPEEEIDALIELLLASRPGPSSGWLTVTFDDGYKDSHDYIAARAHRWPEVEFIFFVCPGKIDQRAGFRWDLVERAMSEGVARDDAMKLLQDPADPARENGRDDLKGLARLPQFELASVASLQALQKLPNVALGNHTNLHLAVAKLPDAVVADDLKRSTATFEKLFGPMRHFAFPYGTPEHHFTRKHVDLVRGAGNPMLWSTHARPYLPEERKPGAVLPRFGVDGFHPARELAGWITARSLRLRMKGPHHQYR